MKIIRENEEIIKISDGMLCLLLTFGAFMACLMITGLRLTTESDGVWLHVIILMPTVCGLPIVAGIMGYLISHVLWRGFSSNRGNTPLLNRSEGYDEFEDG